MLEIVSMDLQTYIHTFIHLIKMFFYMTFITASFFSERVISSKDYTLIYGLIK
jgi:hypothetical protein